MFKKHPNGLKTLFFTEMWERFGLYTMMAIFVLYMDIDFGWSDEIKGLIYGSFLLAVYIFPILGGWIADKFLGARKTIMIGGFTLAVGYGLLAASSLDRLPIFYLGLITIAAGNGFFKANISVLVGNLYEPDSKLKDAGYNIFYMGINIGAFLAPLVATYLRGQFNFNVCFLAASFGMLISLIIFQFGKQNYMHSQPSSNLAVDKNSPSQPKQMDKKESQQRVVTLLILCTIAFFFWMAFYQNGSGLTLFAERSTVHYKYLKAETYQFFNPFFIVLLTPVIVLLFSRLGQKGKEPNSAIKICLGMFVSGVALIIMVISSLKGGNQDIEIMSPAWLISTYFMITISELLVSPMGLSFTSKVAPPHLQGMMMGFWFGATGLGAFASGLLTSFYSKLPHHVYFLILIASLFFAGFLVLFFMKKLVRFSS